MDVVIQFFGIGKTVFPDFKKSCFIFAGSFKFRFPDIRGLREKDAVFFRIAGLLRCLDPGVLVDKLADALMDRSVLVDQIVVVFIVRIVIFQGAFVDPDGKLHPVFVCPESVGGDRDTHRGRKDRFRISGQGEEKSLDAR